MRHVPSRSTRRIAVVQSSVNVRRLAPGLAPFSAAGYDFWVIDLYRQPGELLASLREWKPAAIITEWHPGLTEALVGLGCPVVLAPSDQAVAGTRGVDVDDVAIGRLAAEHLISRGYRKFAFVGRADAHYAKQRLEGFAAVVGETPVYWEEFRDWRQYDEYWRDPDGDMVGWLASLPGVAGVFAAHDPTGRHVLEAAAQAGLEVPFALGVVSANDDETVCEMARPALTSIRLPWRRLAAESMAVIEAARAGHPPAAPVLAPPLEVVARGSTAYEAVGDAVVRRAMKLLLENVAGVDSVERWAAETGVSRRVLERRFQEALGKPPMAVIRRERVERAKKLLATTDLPVSQVAERCGFQSNERLTVNFVPLVGVPPATFRKRAREKPELRDVSGAAERSGTGGA